MKRNIIPIGSIAILGISLERKLNVVELEKIRTLTITAKCTYDGSATVGAVLNLYYSPDGENWDTIPYAYFNINLTAGSTVQETHNIDAPEHGYMSIAIKNNDSSYTVTDILIFKSESNWGEKKCRE